MSGEEPERGINHDRQRNDGNDAEQDQVERAAREALKQSAQPPAPISAATTARPTACTAAMRTPEGTPERDRQLDLPRPASGQSHSGGG
jgi:hypothetical protein